ncbi:hypothetical protein [Aurantiacibacter gilvus]|uniref:Uncharacterized protein n=1 Tax=Aurantiacibacter gilvus TaxID=3139141 RepID=A0ABU9IHF0_9SPHN
MTAEGFALAFDIRTSPDPFWSASGAMLFLFPIMGILLFVFAPKLPNLISPRSMLARRVIAGFVVLFSVPLALIVTVSRYNDRSDWTAQLASGEADFVEGCLDWFHPMPRDGHESEIVAVDGRVFRYSDFNLTTPFNNTRSHGGPIESTSAVRIWHDGNAILRLEVRRQACPSAADPGADGPPSGYGTIY